jgi:hypothetical protein
MFSPLTILPGGSERSMASNEAMTDREREKPQWRLSMMEGILLKRMLWSLPPKRILARN